MQYKSDIEIAQGAAMRPIAEIAKTAHVDEKYIEQYGRYKAKIDPALLKETQRKDGRLVLVTAITPTPAGEGKTTTTIGLAFGIFGHFLCTGDLHRREQRILGEILSIVTVDIIRLYFSIHG